MKSAYTAVIVDDGAIIGRADEGTIGYTPITSEGIFDDYNKAKKRADEMNELYGIDKKEAIKIVLETIRSGLGRGY